MLRMTSSLAREIRAQGEAAYPNECCGALLGLWDPEGVREATGIFPIPNARESGEQYHRFVITPEDFLRAEKAARAEGLEVLGFYHSHPDHPAAPSDYDREHALPVYAYVITAVADGRAEAMTSWRLSPDRARFDPEDILI
ncbi:MAG: M67 family metallopeptidase [Oscillospiraceae bacterium]|jgi:proteasome lid subunit RPN8/RPN11|nr:M67 family metallopeptidase [Oscillospiraceae bacterium]